MGETGSKQSDQAAVAAEQVLSALVVAGDVTSRKMFGGYGIFETGRMFALINPSGDVFLKTDETNLARFEGAGMPKHGRMPYYRVPPPVLSDSDQLLEWALISIAIAHKRK